MVPAQEMVIPDARDTTGVVPWDFAACRRVLDEFAPHMSSRTWMWTFLRRRFDRRDAMPWNSYRRLRWLGNPRRPYFVAETRAGTRFLGDYRDVETAQWILDRSLNVGLVRLIAERAGHREGAYLDVGANNGVLAATVAGRLPGRPIIAIEAVPAMAKIAAATFALNGIESGLVLPVAAGSSDSTVALEVAEGYSGQSSVYAVDDWKGAREAPRARIVVPCRRLDSLQGLLPPPALVKIDVEGHELEVLRGASGLLSRDRPDIVYEYNPRVARLAGWAPAVVQDHLAAAGYRSYVIDDAGGLTALSAGEVLEDFCNVFCTVSAA